MVLLKEFCAENCELLSQAIEAGARRIELCDNLSVGGTTPSYGVIKAAVAYAHEYGTSVMTMIRSRGGNFTYTEDELAIMCDDIAVAAQLGTDGVVFGCVRDDVLDRSATQLLIDATRASEDARRQHVAITFHMAFDSIGTYAQFEALDWLAERGVERILTHGGPASRSIDKNLQHLQDLIEYAADRIVILPGGGITTNTCEAIASSLGVSELHGTRIVF